MPDIQNINISVDNGMGEPVCLIRMREPVIFPFALTSVTIDSSENIQALSAAMQSDRMIAVFNEIPSDQELGYLQIKGVLPQFKDGRSQRCAIGTLARVVKEIRLPDNTRRIVVRGLKRIIGASIFRNNAGVEMIRYRTMQDQQLDNSNDIIGYQKGAVRMFQELMSMQPGIPDELQISITGASTPTRCADALSDTMNFSYAEKLILLAAPSVENRFELLTVLINRELETCRMGIQIQNEVQESMSASQREFYLREQLKAIKQELGEFSGNADVADLTRKMENTFLPDLVSETVKRELERLELLPQNAPEYHISYNYINTMLDIPWQITTEDRLDCRTAAKILDEDHYGLEDVKVRILEFLSVMERRQGDENCRAPILCLVGPPGVGKTSIGRSIARAMDRKFIRVSFGGVRDEAEIRGHRRTYVGAMPGRIVQNLKRAGSCNPVFMLDEVDKLAHDFRGDPASALLEVLDPEQNNAFNDNFVELPLDLSKVFFIATANVLEDIPGPLRDRMEVISLAGYTVMEKKEIAKRYLIPRQLKENGIDTGKIKFKQAAINEIIEGYTMEAGVRELDRCIARTCRRIARKFTSGEWNDDQLINLDAKAINELLGARKFLKDSAPVPVPGCATGMAWTSVGGVILPVETTALPGGKGNLKLTGSLGKVMMESAETAFTFVRAHAPEGIKPEFFSEHDFHIHVPDGATPKDGPSAGITITLALMSMLLNKPLIPRLAMTGEITLQGRVTAIGGVREKLVGAIRAGIKVVLVPKENAKDVAELPANIREALQIHFVSTFAEAFKIAFEN